MKRKTIDLSKFKYKYAARTEDGLKEQVDYDKVAKILAFHLAPILDEFLKKYEKEIKAIKDGKMSFEDFDRKVKHDNVHDYLGKIILLIKENPKITLEELAITIGISKKTVQRVIGASDKIVRIGGVRNGHWETKD